MRKYIFTLSFLLITSVAIAQTWAPTGATWHYEIIYPFGQESYIKYESVGDTIILGQKTKIITVTGGTKGVDYLIGKSDTAFTYESGRKIYAFNPGSNSFTLVYDFNKNAGEYWETNWDSCTFKNQINGNRVQTVNSTALKVISFGSSEVIEYIGGTRTLFNTLGGLSCKSRPDSIIAEVPIIQRLRCYQDSFIGYYSTGIAASCDFVTSINDDITFEKIPTVFPNPATSSLTINFHQPNSEYTLKIYTSAGKEVNTIVSSEKSTFVNTNNLQPGIYFIAIADTKGGRWTKRFVKM